MATIKEMAEEYAKEQDLRISCNGSCDTPESAYIKGANAVLENIEKFADYTWGVRSLNTISLKKKIKELKKE